MKKTLHIILLQFALLIFTLPVVMAQVTKPINGAVFSNNIKMNIKGFNINSAALFFSDNKTPVPANNKVAENQDVILKLVIDDGWKAMDGKVFPGVTQVIKLNTGEVLLQSEDYFKSYDKKGVIAADARYINLRAVMTKMVDKKKFAIVSFRVWDKKSGSEITGSYKLFIK